MEITEESEPYKKVKVHAETYDPLNISIPLKQNKNEIEPK